MYVDGHGAILNGRSGMATRGLVQFEGRASKARALARDP